VDEDGARLYRSALPFIVTATTEPLLSPRSGEHHLGLSALVNELHDPHHRSVRVRQAGAVAAAVWAVLWGNGFCRRIL
jgi:hypothetical protein